MDSQIEGNEDLLYLKEKRQHLEERIENRCIAQDELINSLVKLVPNLVSSLDLSLKVVSAFNGSDQNRRARPHKRHRVGSDLHTRAGVLGSGPGTTGGVSHSEDKNASTETKVFSKVGFMKGSEGEVKSRLLRLEDRLDSEKGGSNGGRVSQPRARSIVKVMVAAVLLDRNPFSAIDSAAILRKLENDHLAPAEKNALVELGGEIGGIQAVEVALKALADENAGVELEEFVVSGKTRIMILGIDRNRLAKELPETPQQLNLEDTNNSNGMAVGSAPGTGGGMDLNGAPFGLNPGIPRPDMWIGSGEPHMQGVPGMPAPGPPMFSGGGPPPIMGPRGGPRVMGMMGMPGPGSVPGLGMGFRGVPPMHRPPLGPVPSSGPPTSSSKPRTEEDDMKDLEALLNKKSFREMQKSKTGEELLDLIHRPTARETAVAAKFKTKGGPQLKEYCSALTKEDCRRQGGSYIACEKVHFRRIIALHTDINLGDCSFLDTCRHMKTCKYVHYELDPTPDVPGMMGTPGLPPQKPLKPQRAEYCSEVELGEAQWINCDIRTFRVDILGQFGVIMADPPWDIHMELPYGTMADDEMRNLNVPALQTDGLIFLWVTGRAMELGREWISNLVALDGVLLFTLTLNHQQDLFKVLPWPFEVDAFPWCSDCKNHSIQGYESAQGKYGANQHVEELWGYRRVEELIWVKTNQLQRIIRTGRTGHWLNHSKEHCLVGIKGNPEVNRNIDTDVIVAEVRETSRKPDEIRCTHQGSFYLYLDTLISFLLRIQGLIAKVQLKLHSLLSIIDLWMSLGNQLHGVRLVDEGLRARFKAAYPDVEVQPPSPPRAPVAEAEAAAQARSPFTGIETKVTPEHVGLTGMDSNFNFTEESSYFRMNDDNFSFWLDSDSISMTGPCCGIKETTVRARSPVNYTVSHMKIFCKVRNLWFEVLN
eukprot:Gb_00271 [translate_table: standard]